MNKDRSRRIEILWGVFLALLGTMLCILLQALKTGELRF